MRVKLKDIATYINGKAFKPSEWAESGLPIIRIQNLNNPSKEYNYYDKKVDDKYIIENGDILISWSATLDIFEWKREKALLNQHIFKVIFDKEVELDKSYFKLAISSVLHTMERYTHGSTMKHIVKKDFENIEIPLPPLQKQKAIAQKLDLAQKLIDLRKESITKLDALAKSVFVEMFGDPVENEMGWEVDSLNEVSSKITDGEHGTVARIESGKMYLMARNISRLGKLDLTTISYISDKSHNKIFKRCNAEYNDLLLVCVGATIGKCCLVPKMETFSLARSVALIKPLEEKINSSFLLNFFNIESIQRELKRSSNASAQAGLYTGMIKKIKIIVPPITLQNKFAQTIQKIEAQKALYEQELVKLEESFSGLLQESFF